MEIADLKKPTIKSLKKFLDKSPSDSPFREERQAELLLGIALAAEKYELNPVYILAHAILESGWGRSKIAREKNNLFGYKAYDSSPYESAMKFVDYPTCIDTVMGAVKKEYLTPGGKYFNGATLEGMNVRYATDKTWSEKIRNIMNRIYDES